MFVAGVIGVVVVGAVSHDDHSNYGDHSNHSRYSEYGDSALVSEISNLESRVNSQNAEINNYRDKMKRQFEIRLAELKRDGNYKALSSSNKDILGAVREEMKSELEESIKADKEKLADIDKMIARINDIELLQKKTDDVE